MSAAALPGANVVCVCVVFFGKAAKTKKNGNRNTEFESTTSKPVGNHVCHAVVHVAAQRAAALPCRRRLSPGLLVLLRRAKYENGGGIPSTTVPAEHPDGLAGTCER